MKLLIITSAPGSNTIDPAASSATSAARRKVAAFDIRCVASSITTIFSEASSATP
jgi:hypothetical protein